MSTELYIDENAGGRLTAEALLRSTGSVDIWLSEQVFPKYKFCIFRIADKGFFFNLGFINGELIFQRNQHVLKVDESFFKKLPNNTTFIASWEPDRLTFLLGPRGFQGPSIRKTMNINPIPAPNNLIRWAREQSLLPTKEYEKESDFVARVHSGLAMLQDKIDAMPSRDIFFDINYNNRKIKNRRPKKETDLHGIIHALLSDQFFIASIEVIPEASSGVGNLDFLFLGFIKNCGLMKVCAEFKLAHSQDLYRGIEHQLPSYMKAHGTSNGTYCILDFDAKASDSSDLHCELALAASRGWQDRLSPIKIHHFYLSKPMTASKSK
ncbi:hypothetical protein [Zobellella sp. DQSA1]|uniref:hypothetical protein n=1 Tax=Zobellella sp. DQSA1 TaxID=3342386 RepID=UPI0035C05E65